MTTDFRGNPAERSILTGLAWEWERAVGDLPGVYQNRMRLPNFEIRVVEAAAGGCFVLTCACRKQTLAAALRQGCARPREGQEEG